MMMKENGEFGGFLFFGFGFWFFFLFVFFLALLVRDKATPFHFSMLHI